LDIYPASYDAFVGPDKGSLRPEEVKTDAFAFKILTTTNPVKVSFYQLFDQTPIFVLDLAGIGITTSTSSSSTSLILAPQEYLTMYASGLSSMGSIEDSAVKLIQGI